MSLVYKDILANEVAQCVRLFATPWTVAHQASPSMGFSRQEYWSGVPFPPPAITSGEINAIGDE